METAQACVRQEVRPVERLRRVRTEFYDSGDEVVHSSDERDVEAIKSSRKRRRY